MCGVFRDGKKAFFYIAQTNLTAVLMIVLYMNGVGYFDMQCGGVTVQVNLDRCFFCAIFENVRKQVVGDSFQHDGIAKERAAAWIEIRVDCKAGDTNKVNVVIDVCQKG